MPVTRSQAAAEDRLRVYEDFPASPSADATEPIQPTNPRVATTTAASATVLSATAPPASSAMPSTSGQGPSRVVPTEPAHASGRRPRARSIRSQQSNASAAARIKQAEFEAEERLAEIRRQELQIQAQLIQKRLAADIAAINEETDRESIGARETEHRVHDWLERGDRVDRDLEQTYRALKADEHRNIPNTPNRGVTFDSTRPRSPTPNQSRERGLDRLTDVLEKLALRKPPSRQSSELPIFSGALGEWLPFKATMRDSTVLHRFSPAENIVRLRSCLRGEARQTVSALLYTATDPQIIMRTLEQCYGRPEMIIDNALEEVKKLPRLGSTASELNAFAIKLQNIVTTISCLDDRGYLRNPMLTRQVTEKLTPHLKSKWCDYAEDFPQPREAELATLSRFLMREADRAMRHAFSTSAQKEKSTTITPRPQDHHPRVNDRKSKVVYAATEDQKTECFCCGAEHITTECKKLKAMPVEKRWEWAKEIRICFRCLNSKHRRFRCKKKACGVKECRRPHHALLHAEGEAVESTPTTEESVVTASAHATTGRNKVLLKVCPITVRTESGSEIKTHALLDEGSTITLIDNQLATMIGARGPKRALNVIGVTSSNREPDSQLVNLSIKGTNRKEYHSVNARTVKNLILSRQTVEAELLRHPHLRQLKEEDVCYEQAKPSILIGADNWHLIVTRKLLSGKKTQPAASLTHLGWIVHGTTPMSTQQRTETVLHIQTSQDDLSELVKTHYDIDALGIQLKRKPIAMEERAKEIFDKTAKRVDGRFEVGLPWTSEDVSLPPSYDMAVSRLRSIERKMEKSEEFKNAYTTQMNKLVEKGYAKRCDEDHDENERTWYLPHFAVTNPHKPNKIRLVFDPGAPNQGGAWERMIKTVKVALAVTLNTRAPKEEVLNTLMTEIEHTVNSRPLTHVATDPEEPEALTPNHFLLGTATGMPFVGECDAADRRTWRASQALANSFWARWVKEYLPTLAPRNDIRKRQDNVKPGDLVIIADGTLPRNIWPRGLIERVYPGPDGVVRSAEVRTRGGIFKRPARRLVVLPIESGDGYEDLRRGENVTDDS